MRLTLLLFCIALGPGQTTPSRDRASAPVATGTIRGKVVAATTGDPLQRVQVSLIGGTQSPPPAVTNARGEYEITGLAAGTYTVVARRSGYLETLYGQRRVGERGRPIAVTAGEMTGPIDFSLARGGTLAGVVTDETGAEYPGARVEAVEFRYVRGRRTPIRAAIATTNDLGQYRLSGLPPGPYLLRASAPDTWTSDDGGTGYAFVATFYPGVASLGESETLTLTTAQEIANLNFALKVGRSARIAGVFQGSDGTPVSGQAISLSIITRTIGNAVQSSSAGGSAQTNASGTFVFQNLAPGEYVVSSGSDTDRGSVTLVLGDGDERAVTLGPQQPNVVTGAVRGDRDQRPPFAPSRLRVTAVSADPEYVPPNTFLTGTTSVGPDWTFRYSNLIGPYFFRLEGLPDNWFLANVAANGKDVTDIPLDLRAGGTPIGPLQITISTRGATLEGQIIDANKQSTADATVIVFAANPTRWSVGSRFIKVGRPNSDGTFSITGLVPAPYLVVARENIAEGEWEDPSFLGTLVDAAQAFEGREDETASITLSLRRER